MEYYLAIKTNEIMPFAATWVDLRIIMLTELSQTKQISFDITYMWNLEKKMIQMNLFAKQILRLGKQIHSYERGKGGGEGYI